MAEYVVGESIYVFPDDMDPAEAQRILTEQGVLGPPPKVEEVPEAIARVPEPGEVQVPLAPQEPRPLGARLPAPILASVEEEAAARAEARRPLDTSAGLEEQERQKLMARVERERGAALAPGEEQPEQVPVGGLYGRTPIAVRQVVLPEGFKDMTEAEIERIGKSEGFLLPESLEVPMDPDRVRVVPLRVAVGEDGRARIPTLGEELASVLQRQVVTTEAQLRAEEQEKARRQEAGEGFSVAEYIAEKSPDILQREEEGVGVVETELGAALRGVGSLVKSAAVEAYINAAKTTDDPKDFSSNFVKGLTRLTDTLGVTEEGTFNFAETATSPLQAAVGLVSDDAATAIKQAALSLPIPTVPMPSVVAGTRREEGGPTVADPTGARAVLPKLETDTPVEQNARRVFQNAASGRSIGDEFVDLPALSEQAEERYGTPMAAYYSGLLQEFGVPTAVGVVTGTLKGAGAIGGALKTAPTAGASRETMLAIARKAVGRALPEDKVDAGLRALQALEDSGAAVDDLSVGEALRAAGISEAAAVKQLVKLNTPGDYVMVSDTLGVPRQMAPMATELVAANRARALLKSTDDVVLDVVKAAEETGDANLIASARKLAERTLDYTARPTVVDPRPSAGVRQSLAAVRKLPDAAGRALTGLWARPASAKTPGVPFGFGGLSRADRRAAEGILRRVAGTTGKNAADFVGSFDMRSPRAVASRSSRFLESFPALEKYGSWAEIPAEDLRRVMAVIDSEVSLGPAARRATDLTRAQIHFRTLEQGFSPMEAIRALGPAGRRVAAKYGKLTTETLQTNRTAREIQRVGRTAMRRLSEETTKLAGELGSVDQALDTLMRKYLVLGGREPKDAWGVLLGSLYGDKGKDDILRFMESLGDTRSFSLQRPPTMASLRELDDFFRSERGGELIVALSRKVPGLSSFVEQDFQNAFLRGVTEEGLRHAILKDKKLTDMIARGEAVEKALDLRGLLAARSSLVRGFPPVPGEWGSLSSRLERGFKFPEAVKQARLPPEWAGEIAHFSFGGAETLRQPAEKVALYDEFASWAEKELSGAGEGLFTMLDSFPVRLRGDVASFATDALGAVVSSWRKALSERVKYGYVVPNLPVQLGRLVEIPLLSVLNAGLADTAKGLDRAGQKAINAVWGRKVFGGGLRTPDGVYYTPQQLAELGDSVGLGNTRLESERIGSLASDLLRDAQRAAKGRGTAARGFASWVNPMDRSLFLRMAEAIDLSFRQSMFEVGLARGLSPDAAGELARTAAVDYGEVPDAIKTYLAPYLAGASHYYKTGGTLLNALLSSPDMAPKTLRAYAQEVQRDDPYGVYGDSAVKSMGLWAPKRLGAEGRFYGPKVGILNTPERLLATLTASRNLYDNIRFAYDQAGVGAVPGQLAQGAVEGSLAVVNEGLNGVLDSLERYEEQKGGGASRPSLEGMSDEGAYWSLALLAQATGQWDTFNRVFTPVAVPAPEARRFKYGDGVYADKLWTVPPLDKPHLLWAEEDGQKGYLVLEPSPEGLRNIALARTVVGDSLAPFVAPAVGDEGPLVVPGGAESFPEAALQAAFPRAKDPTVLRQAQAQQLRRVRDEPEVQ